MHGPIPVVKDFDWLGWVARKVHAPHVVRFYEGVQDRRRVELQVHLDEPSACASLEVPRDVFHFRPHNVAQDRVVSKLYLSSRLTRRGSGA